jgi:hypothetical protein
MLMRAEQDVVAAGQRVHHRPQPWPAQAATAGLGDDRLRVRSADPDYFGDALDGELLGYMYTPRMPGGSWGEGTVLLPDEVAHYAPYPDPQTHGRGMSWLTPVLREIQSDESALIHKESFFRNGAGPRLAMKLDPSIQKADFERFAATIEAHHTGPWNAYKTLYLAGGADPVPMTFNLRDLDYKNVIGRRRDAARVGRRRAADDRRVLRGSRRLGPQRGQLQAVEAAPRRRHAAPAVAQLRRSLEAILPPPAPGSRLWYDDRDIAFLRDDEGDAADDCSQAGADDPHARRRRV